MRRLKLRNLTICLCMICVVTFSVATPIMRVSALAQEITPELEPVYDTEVVSLQDYVDNILTDAQVAVFNTILGSYVASQAGLNEYDLEYPYNDRSGVIGWLQDAGMKLYNAIITGGSFDLVTGTDLRTYIITAASYAIGMAQKAHTYTDMNDFLDDVDNSTHYFVPIDPILQASINSYFGRSYGLWNWQFQTKPFENYVEYEVMNADALNTINEFVGRGVRFNLYWNPYIWYNGKTSDLLLSTYHNLYVNTSTLKVSIVDDYGNVFPSGNHLNNLNTVKFGLYYYSTVYEPYIVLSDDLSNFHINDSTYYSYTDYTFDVSISNYKELVRDVFGNALNFGRSNGNVLPIYSDFIDHVYVGSNWATKQEIFNVDDLNFAQNDSPSYNQVPDNSYIDLKGFLTDIVNNTNILNVILNNLFKPDGTLNVDPTLVKVSITIPDTNPLPVNLNDVSELIDNTYLDLVKQRATQASETIGEYVAFWHNCDPEVVYVSLGAILIIAIGAFIGKWGHS